MPEFPSTPQSESVSAAEFMAERADIFRAARALADRYVWADGLNVGDVQGLAEFLAGDHI